MQYYVWVKLFKAIKSFLELLFISIFVGLKMRSEEKNYNMSRQTDEEGSTTGVKSLRNNTKNKRFHLQKREKTENIRFRVIKEREGIL